MTRSNYLIKDYEHMVNGRVLCKEHGRIRCSECAYVDDLEKQNKRYREALEEILAEAYEEAGVHPDTGMQLETYIARIARKALEGSE